jgi:hypothetical protein
MEKYTVIGFEARAMVKQFLYYTKGINLFPFCGDAHIEPKWKLAKHLEDAHRWYGGKPMQFLYFGDCDEKGEMILKAAMKDVRRWCDQEIEIEAKWCGLTREQAKRFHVPKNPDKPGQYQWEALTDPQAKEIIELALAKFGVDVDLIKKKAREGERLTKEWRKKIERSLKGSSERKE